MVSPHFFERRRALSARVGKNLPAKCEAYPQGGGAASGLRGCAREETRNVRGRRGCFGDNVRLSRSPVVLLAHVPVILRCSQSFPVILRRSQSIAHLPVIPCRLVVPWSRSPAASWSCRLESTRVGKNLPTKY